MAELGPEEEPSPVWWYPEDSYLEEQYPEECWSEDSYLEEEYSGELLSRVARSENNFEDIRYRCPDYSSNTRHGPDPRSGQDPDSSSRLMFFDHCSFLCNLE